MYKEISLNNAPCSYLPPRQLDSCPALNTEGPEKHQKFYHKLLESADSHRAPWEVRTLYNCLKLLQAQLGLVSVTSGSFAQSVSQLTRGKNWLFITCKMRNVTFFENVIKLSPVSVKGTEESMCFCLNTNKKDGKQYLIICYVPSAELGDSYIFFHYTAQP